MLPPLLRETDGVAAVEFALVSPFFVFAFLAMVDAGLVLNEKLAVDQIMRSGAHIAMTDPGTQAVYDSIAATAASEYTVVAAPQEATVDQISLAVTRFFACPESPDVSVAAGTTCAGSQPTSAFYRAVATKPYDEILLRYFEVNSVIQVQVR
ncbi:TadE/TadG family type IV pilus assembly protein [Fulvimarina sp. MAC8]|uniref:TadE/TadG family type IV pilus assembly protein n=1 Tax=Fulvimarina sp. MAC8 TaxID=3162874 RepID=UPI0032EEC534